MACWSSIPSSKAEASWAQRLIINSVEDPHTIFFDPKARKANRQDAMWAGNGDALRQRELYREVRKNRKILQPSGLQRAGGWIADALGIGGNLAQLNEWTGAGEGPFYVCEFCMVEIEPATLRLYTDISRALMASRYPPAPHRSKAMSM